MTNWTHYKYENLPAEGKFGVILTSRGCTFYEEVSHVVIWLEFQKLWQPNSLTLGVSSD